MNFFIFTLLKMRVRLIKKKTIEDFAFKNANSRSSFRLWLSVIKVADWEISEHITATFGSADLLGNGSNRVVFDIGGNHYRMICKYHFTKTMVHLYVKWIGSHSENNKLCSSNRQYIIDIF